MTAGSISSLPCCTIRPETKLEAVSRELEAFEHAWQKEEMSPVVPRTDFWHSCLEYEERCGDCKLRHRCTPRFSQAGSFGTLSRSSCACRSSLAPALFVLRGSRIARTIDSHSRRTPNATARGLPWRGHAVFVASLSPCISDSSCGAAPLQRAESRDIAERLSG